MEKAEVEPLRVRCRAKRIGLLTCTAGLVFGVAPAAGGSVRGGSVKLWPAAVVTGDVIRLGDVAELRGFDADTEMSLKDAAVTTAPEPDGSRIIPLSVIREALKNFGVNRATVIVKGAAECAVRRPAQAARPTSKLESPPERVGSPAGRPTLRDAITAYFDRQLAAYGGRADVGFGRTSAQVLDLSGPEFEFRVRHKPGPSMGLIHIDVTILRGAVDVQRIPMVVNVAMVRDVVVARRAINRGATVRAEDVQLAPRQFARPGRIGLTDPGEVIGLRAQRFVPSGELIAARDLERVPLVKRGQIVEVVSRFGNVTVKTAAKASEDGDYGELVTLHIQGRRKARTVGRVIGPRRVETGDRERLDSDQALLAHGGSR